MNNLIVMLIDFSSSMRDGAKLDATIAGYNRFLSLQQMRRNDCQMLLGYFNMDYFEQAYRPLSEMAPLDYNTYRPNGGTCMYTSMRSCIESIDAHIAALPVDEQPATVIMVTQSDGATDQSQTEIDARDWIKNVMNTRSHWQFAFMGCDAGAVREANKIWSPTMIMNYNGADASAFERASEAILESVITGKMGRLNGA